MYLYQPEYILNYWVYFFEGLFKMVDLEARCPSGITGLDGLLNGGFPRSRSILVSGTCGTGKSTFGAQFVANGIREFGENGILVSLEQDPREMKADMLQFGFDLQKFEDEGKLVIIDASLSRMGLKPKKEKMSYQSPQFAQVPGSISLLPDEFNMEMLLEIVVSKAKRIDARRVVVDSLPALDFLLKEANNDIKQSLRETLLAMNYRLKMEGLTTLLITEMAEQGEAISAHGIESYVVDGVIILYYISIGTEAGRSLIVRKMRATKHSEDVHPIRFEEGTGIRGLRAEDAYNI